MTTIRRTIPTVAALGWLLAAASAAPSIEANATLHSFSAQPTSWLAQDDDEKEKPDKRDEIKEMIDTLDDHVKKKGKEDAEALALIDKLLTEFPESGPKDRKSIVKQMTSHFKVKRKQTKEGLLDNKLFNASAVAMGRMAPESTKELIKWVGHKSLAKNVEVKRTIVLALGNTGDEDAVSPLMDLLKNHEARIQAAAAESLGKFDGVDQKLRKKMFEAIMKEIIRVKNIIDVEQVDQIERKRYDTIAGPMLTSMQTLSGHDARDPNAFRDWWNDNKRKDWDDGKDD